MIDSSRAALQRRRLAAR